MLDVDPLLGRQSTGQVGQGLVGGSGQTRKTQGVKAVAEQLPADGGRPIERVRQLDDRRAPVRLQSATEGQLVGGPAKKTTDELVERLCMCDLILGQRAEGDVLLQDRRQARPV